MGRRDRPQVVVLDDQPNPPCKILNCPVPHGSRVWACGELIPLGKRSEVAAADPCPAETSMRFSVQRLGRFASIMWGSSNADTARSAWPVVKLFTASRRLAEILEVANPLFQRGTGAETARLGALARGVRRRCLCKVGFCRQILDLYSALQWTSPREDHASLGGTMNQTVRDQTPPPS